MDFNLRDDESASAKMPRLFFDSGIIIKQEHEGGDDDQKKNGEKTECSVSPHLHLFVPLDDDDENEQQQISNTITTNGLSEYPFDCSTHTPPPKIGGDGSYFSYGQWQELELQALIYRHMLAGAAIPPQLLQMVQKSLFNISPSATNSTSSAYYAHPLQQYSHYHPALLQSGYWGRGAMDPEPGRCRRTDGKKWRCSRDVVGGQKYCERHVHRGRNRSRKSVELPAATTAPRSTLGGGTGSNSSTTNNTASAQVIPGSRTHFYHSVPSATNDRLHNTTRSSVPQAESKFTSKIEDKANRNLKPGGQALRHFFDDWSGRSSDSSSSSTSLSISTPGNMPSDFSLKLATGNRTESGETDRTQSGWGGAGWGPTNQVAPMGGPLAEALRSSRGSNASPTSVLNLVK